MRAFIEATLAPEIKADILFSHTIEGGSQIVEILDAIKFWNAPPIDDRDLMKLADDWLQNGGGYDACCRVAEEAEGGTDQ